jgi:hypothetical protein
MPAQSAIAGLARGVDLAGPLPPLPPRMPRSWDQILLNDDFHDGINGWHTHTNFTCPYLSDHSFQRSANSLKLSLGHTTSSNSIYKRLGVTFADGYLFFGGWFAFRGTQEHGSPAQLTFAIDHQEFDDTGRSFSQLVLRRYVGEGAEEKFSPRWSLIPNQIPTTPAANVWVDIPGSVVSKYPAEAGKGSVPGWNINHGDYWFAGLLMSCNSSDNSAGVGIGRYWRAYCGDTIFDLSTLKTNSEVTENGEKTKSGEGTGTGSGALNPQIDTSSGGPNAASSFSGGLNLGLGISSRGSTSEECALFAGHMFAAHYPVGTTFPTGSEG